MDRNELKKDFLILEVSDKASFQDVKESYLLLKNLYTSNSRIFSSFTNDTITKKKEFLSQIEDSYHRLKTFFEEEDRRKTIETETRVSENKIPEFEIYSGNSLRLIREVLGIELEEVAFSSGINLTHLKNIEEEKYSLLPPKAYIKAFVRKYADHLSLNPVKVSNDYIHNMEKKQKAYKLNFSSKF